MEDAKQKQELHPGLGHNQPSQDFLRVVNSGDETDIFVYGQIGNSFFSEGITASSIAKTLKDIPKSRKINLRINSPGGSVAEGLAIYNLLSERRSKLTTHIDGYALSAASFIGLAAKKVVIPESGIVMIHNPHTMAAGDASEMRRQAEILDTHRDAILNIYAKHSRKSREQLIADMDSETWLSGSEAVDYGLAHEVSDAAPVTNGLPDEYRDIVADRFGEVWLGVKSLPPLASGDLTDVLNVQTGIEDMPTQNTDVQAAEVLAAKDLEIVALKGANEELRSTIVALQTELKEIKSQQVVGTRLADLRRQAEKYLASAQMSRAEFDRMFGESLEADITNVIASGRAEIKLEVMADYLEAVGERTALLPTQPKVKEQVPDRSEPKAPETPYDDLSADDYATRLVSNLRIPGV